MEYEKIKATSPPLNWDEDVLIFDGERFVIGFYGKPFVNEGVGYYIKNPDNDRTLAWPCDWWSALPLDAMPY